MKVKLLPKVSSYAYKGLRYVPGDKFEIEDIYFCEDFMKSLEAPVVVAPKPVLEPKSVKEEPAKKVTKKKTAKKEEPALASEPESEATSEAKES